MKRIAACLFLASLLTPLALSAAPWTEAPRHLVLFPENDPGTPRELVRALRSEGGHASVIVPGSGAIVYAEPEVLRSAALAPWISATHRGAVEPAAVDGAQQRLVRIWNRVLEMRAAPVPTAGVHDHAAGDRMPSGRRIPVELQPRSLPGGRDAYEHIPYGAEYFDTSTYLAGTTSVAVWLLEAAGSTYDWTVAEEDETLAGVVSGFDMWVVDHGGTMAFLSFVLEINTGVPVSGVPIENPQSLEWMWIEEVMAAEGYGTGNAWDRCFAYNNDLRLANETNWCYSLFIVDSDPAVNQGLFSTGGYAWAYYGGPWIYMSRYSSWAFNAANYFEAVPMHEMGHIFFTTDEYDGQQQWQGYLRWPDNANINVICLMNQNANVRICGPSKSQLAWRDGDGNGVMMPLDPPPGAPVDELLPDPTSDPTPTWTGTAEVGTITNLNPAAPYNPPHDITVATIDAVECRVDGGPWSAAVADDGTFDAYVEGWSWTAPALAPGFHTVEARARSSVGIWTDVYDSDTIEIQGAVGVAEALAPAGLELLPPRPNPAGGPVSVAFTVARAGEVRLAVHSVDGRRVRTLLHRELAAGRQTATWDGRGEDGHPAPAGVYFVRLEADGQELTRRFTRIR